MKLLLCLFGLMSFGAARAQTCDCAADLRFVRQAYEQNYAGFADALVRRGVAAHQQLADSLQLASPPATDAVGCEKLLLRYVRFFGDGHAFLTRTAAFPRSPSRADRAMPRNRKATLEVLDAQAVLLIIPSADLSRQQSLDSLLAANRALLARTPDLLVDVRGNGGGSATVFLKLLELLYTRPVVLDGIEYRSSPRNLAKFREGLTKPDASADMRKGLREVIARMEATPNGFVLGQPGRTRTLGQHPVQANPQRVSILIDHRCASATEEFLLAARQSSKVTLFGQPTEGTLDYADLYLEPLPSGLFAVSIPMSRSLRLPDRPFDADGLKPDVVIPSWQFDWVSFVRNYWRTKG